MERGRSARAGTGPAVRNGRFFSGCSQSDSLVRSTETVHAGCDEYLSWAGGSDPFDPDARLKAVGAADNPAAAGSDPRCRYRLGEFGHESNTIRSPRRSLRPDNLKEHSAPSTWQSRTAATTFSITCLPACSFKSRASGSRSIQRFSLTLSGWFIRSRCRPLGLTDKNKRFLRQFDDPDALRRLVGLPDKLWAEVKRDSRPSFRTLAKAHVAIAIAILTYLPVRVQNLSDLTFDTHLFLNAGAGATSTLELSNGEVKNKRELAFDVPPRLTKMLLEYRDRIAPKILGHRPKRLFVNRDGRPKSSRSIATLIRTYARNRAGLALSPHQFRHLSAKVLLDAQPGAFQIVSQLLGHKNEQTTVNAYAGIDTRRAARHHQRLIDDAIAPQLAKLQRGSRLSDKGR